MSLALRLSLKSVYPSTHLIPNVVRTITNSEEGRRLLGYDD